MKVFQKIMIIGMINVFEFISANGKVTDCKIIISKKQNEDKEKKVDKNEKVVMEINVKCMSDKFSKTITCDKSQH